VEVCEGIYWWFSAKKSWVCKWKGIGDYMELEIKEIVSADVIEFRTWKPKNLEDVYFVIELSIGYLKEYGYDIFQTVITTSEALRKRGISTEEALKRKYFLVDAYNWKKIESDLAEIVRGCTCRNWDESVKKLTKHFSWEYDDERIDE